MGAFAVNTLRKSLSLVLVFCISTFSTGTLSAQSPSPAPASPGDPWPRQIKNGTDDLPDLPAPARQLEGQPARGARGGVGQGRGRQGPDLRRDLVHRAHRGRQGQPRRLPRGLEHHARRASPRPRPSAAAWQAALQENENRRRSPRRSRSTASRRTSGIVTAKKTGESRPLNNAPPQIIFSNVPAVLVLVDGAPVFPARHGHGPAAR